MYFSVLGHTEVSCGIFWAIHTETKPSLMYIEIEYYMYDTQLQNGFNTNKPSKSIKNMIKMNKQWCFNVSFIIVGRPGVSWGVLG